MAKRPILEKKLRRLRKQLGRKPLPAYIDLIAYLKLHRFAQTTGQARKLLIDGKVKAESHTIGRVQVPVQTPDGKVELEWRAERLVPAELREQIRVAA